MRDLDDGRLTPPSSPQCRQPRSTPTSPAPSKRITTRDVPATPSKATTRQSQSPIRQILNSPLLNRRARNKKKQQNLVESSDDENHNGIVSTAATEDVNSGNKHYRDLETFQKAQLRQKVKVKKLI